MDGKLEYIKMSIISTSVPSITLLFGTSECNYKNHREE